MSKQILVSLDLAKNELQNAKVHVLASAPGTPAEGQIYYDSTSKAAYIYNGTAWRPFDAAKLTDGTIVNTALATNPLSRANHTGTQTASTISDFDTQVRTSRLDQMSAPTASVSMNSQKITGLGTPTADTDAATKIYVDNAVAGLSWKDAVRAATTANITLSGTQTIDGISVAAGERVLVKDQSTGSQNGIYVVASGAWTRALDADTESELLGAAVLCQEGTTNAGVQFVLTTDAPIVVDTTSLNFAQFGGGQSYSAGTALSLSGNTFNVDAGTGITTAGDSVAIDTSVVVRKYAVSVGNGSNTSFTVNHNLNTTDITAQVHRVASPYDVIDCEIECTDANNITVRFVVAPTTNQFRVVVHG